MVLPGKWSQQGVKATGALLYDVGSMEELFVSVKPFAVLICIRAICLIYKWYYTLSKPVCVFSSWQDVTF